MLGERFDVLFVKSLTAFRGAFPGECPGLGVDQALLFRTRETQRPPLLHPQELTLVELRSAFRTHRVAHDGEDDRLFIAPSSGT